MSGIFTDSQYRAAIGSINYNASNFQVFSFTIGVSVLFGLSLIAGGLIGINTEDETLNQDVLNAFAIVMTICLGLIVLAFTAYLRNIGTYIYGRMKPFNFGQKPVECVLSTGTTRTRISR
jgi:hypothetical protein